MRYQVWIGHYPDNGATTYVEGQVVVEVEAADEGSAEVEALAWAKDRIRWRDWRKLMVWAVRAMDGVVTQAGDER